MRAPQLFAGVELGGTKCVAILGRGPGDLIDRVIFPTTTPDATLGALERTLEAWQSAHGFAALGIASFGPLDVDMQSATFGAITRTPKPGWSGVQIRDRLSHVANAPTAFDTDVNGAALAEMRWGSGQGFVDFAYITVGTGVGVGLIVKGQRTGGFAHCELGHVRVTRLPGDTFAGTCPFHGDCVEGLAAGPSLEARSGGAVSDLEASDPVWNSVAWALAQLCHGIVCAAAPQVIAIGGGVVSRQPHLLPMIERLLKDSLAGYVTLPAEEHYIREPALGVDAGPLGALALAMTALS